MDCFGTYFTHVQKALLWTWQPAHMEHTKYSGKTAKDLYLTTCTHGAHKKHSCKNKGVHTATPFRVYRRGPWPRVQMRPLTACTDEAVTLATLARTIRVYLRLWPRTIRVYLRPQKVRAQPTPWPRNCPNNSCQQQLFNLECHQRLPIKTAEFRLSKSAEPRLSSKLSSEHLL